MPTTRAIAVKDLKLDLRNFRTTPQKNETGAIRALIAGNQEWFWALTESLLDDGYQITENIIVLNDPQKGGLIVREGNRRIAALKLCLGLVRRSSHIIPSEIETRIEELDERWKKSNSEVPCAIYAKSEEKTVDKIVTLTHGKGEKAGRDKWRAIARARHNRDANGGNEPALDLLERYLKHGKNLTERQKERWGGDYPLSVLDEAMKRIAPRVSAASTREVADQYPKKIKKRGAVEDVLVDIGLQSLTFTDLRDKHKDILQIKYRIPEAVANSSTTPGAASSSGGTSTSGAVGATSTASAAAANKKTKAVATTDPLSVRRKLLKFVPLGPRRDKVVTLLKEARTLVGQRHFGAVVCHKSWRERAVGHWRSLGTRHDLIRSASIPNSLSRPRCVFVCDTRACLLRRW